MRGNSPREHNPSEGCGLVDEEEENGSHEGAHSAGGVASSAR